MSRNEIILGAVALVLVVFSLVVSMVIPRRSPDFPKRLLPFVLVSVLLVIATLGAVELFGVEEHNEEAEVTEVQDSGEPDAETPTTTGADTTEGGGGGGDPEAGSEVFASAGCGNCHTFEPAGSSGSIGPNLDEAGVSAEAAAEQVRNGGNGMPAYGGQLSDDDIQNVAAFVAGSGGG